jgi:hypothetical protein
MKLDELYKIIEEGSAIRSWSCLMLDMSFLSEEMTELHEAICPCDVYDDEPGHGIELETHGTVIYGIDPSYKPHDVYNAINLRPCRFKFKGISLFENEKFDVVKFDILSKDLHDLHQEVKTELDCPGNSYPNYQPHTTIFYAKKGTGKYYTNLETDLIGKSFTSNKFIFSNPYSEKVIWTV